MPIPPRESPMVDKAPCGLPAVGRLGLGAMLRIGLLAVLLCAAAAGGLLGRRIYLDRTPPAGAAAFFVGGQKLMAPRAMIRDPALRDGGAVERLDLALKWPGFDGAVNAPRTDAAAGLIFVSVEDAQTRAAQPGDIDPSERPGELYARFLALEAWSNPGGLVMRRFRAGTPYEGEELYVSTPDERQFAARCPAQGASPVGEEQCLWQTRVSGLELQVRFPPRLLGEWPGLVRGVGALVPRLKAGA
jgi:hypothetical protein